MDERCGANRVITVEKKDEPKRLEQEAFVTRVNGSPVGDGQHFIGVGVTQDYLNTFVGRCNRCTGCAARACDINTRTIQHPKPQAQNS